MSNTFRPGTVLARLASLWSRRKAAYKAIPDVALRDLAWFCHAESDCTTERELGRREVWLRIRRIRDLSDDELTVLYAALTPEQRYQLYHPGATYTEE